MIAIDTLVGVVGILVGSIVVRRTLVGSIVIIRILVGSIFVVGVLVRGFVIVCVCRVIGGVVTGEVGGGCGSWKHVSVVFARVNVADRCKSHKTRETVHSRTRLVLT